MATLSLLEAQQFSVHGTPRPRVAKVNFCAREGEIVGIVGPNGAGKSTLLRALLGLVPVSSGAIIVLGAALTTLSRREIAQRMAYVAQHAEAAAAYSVHDVVAMGRAPLSLGFGALGNRDQDAVNDALDMWNLHALRDRTLDTLSGGERRRVDLARACAQNARIMVLDEPDSFLDLRVARQMEETLRRWVGAARCVVVSLHDLNAAARLCDTIVLLGEGIQHAFGTPAEVLTEHHLASVFGVDATVASGPPLRIDVQRARALD